MLKQLLLAAFAAWSLACAALEVSSAQAAVVTEQSAAELRATLDRKVPALLVDHKVPSVSIAVIRRGRLELAAAYGFQSPGTPATTRTLYNIASLTKPLSAEVVLRLASKGLLSLDEPMANFWTDPDIASDPRRMILTARLALTHQTGFPNWRDRKTGLKFKRDPGTGYGYSGEGFEYMARFAEKKVGRPFEELAQIYLFDEVGMKDTAYTGRPWFEGRIAVPTNAEGNALEPYIAKHYNAADLVYTTPTDYAAFLAEVWKDSGLTAQVARDRTRIHVSMMEDCAGAAAATCPPALGFGLGWEVAAFPHDTLLLHTGHDDGIYTVAYLDKSTGDGVVIFTNGQNGSEIAPTLVGLIGVCPPCVRFLQGQI